MSKSESVNLFYTEGSSDKVYQAQLIEVEGGWKVNAQNGRRGGTLKSQNKTPDPVSYGDAKKIYDSLVKAKLKKGYTPDKSGSVYQDTVVGQDFTGIVPQLLNPVREEADIAALVADDDWIAQEKHDGERRMLRKHAGKVEGINRDGIVVPLALGVADYFGALPDDDFVVDGEIMGDRYVAFDLFEAAGVCLRAKPYRERLERLEALMGNATGLIEVVQTAVGTDAKQALADQVRTQVGEGVVFKQSKAPYAAGRPASGGSQRKWKFVESATLIAGKATKGKRSVQVMALLPDGSPKSVGKVTVPANHEMPDEGVLVEVGYLYRMPGDEGALFQPTYKGLRPDKQQADDFATLKVKRETVAPQRRKPRA